MKIKPIIAVLGLVALLPVLPLSSNELIIEGQFLEREDADDMGDFLGGFGRSTIEQQIANPRSNASITTHEGDNEVLQFNVPRASSGGNVSGTTQFVADVEDIITFECDDYDYTRMTSSGVEIRIIGKSCQGGASSSVRFQYCTAPKDRQTQCEEVDYRPASPIQISESSPEIDLLDTDVRARDLVCEVDDDGVPLRCQITFTENYSQNINAEEMNEEAEARIADQEGRGRAAQVQRIRQGGQSETFDGETSEQSGIYDFRRDIAGQTAANEGREDAIRGTFLATGNMTSGLPDPETGQVINHGPLSLEALEINCESECLESEPEPVTVGGFCDISIPVYNRRDLHNASETGCSWDRPTYDESCTYTETFDTSTGALISRTPLCERNEDEMCWKLVEDFLISQEFTPPVCPAEPPPVPEGEEPPPPCIEPPARLISQTFGQSFRCDINDDIPDPCEVSENCQLYRNYCQLEEGIGVRSHPFFGLCAISRERYVCLEEFRECTTQSDFEVDGGCVLEGDPLCNSPAQDKCYYFGGMSGELPDSDVPPCYASVCTYISPPGGGGFINAPHIEDEPACNTTGFSQACVPEEWVPPSCVPQGCTATGTQCVGFDTSGAGEGNVCALERQFYQCEETRDVCTSTQTVCREETLTRVDNESLATGMAAMAVLQEFGASAGACGLDTSAQFGKSLEAGLKAANETVKSGQKLNAERAVEDLACGLFGVNCPPGRGGGMMLDKMTGFDFPAQFAGLQAKAGDPREDGATPPCLFTIFDGIGERCRKPIGSSIQLAADCCDAGLTKESNRLLNACNTGDIRIANARRSQSNVFMGTRCTSSIRLGFGFRICIERSEWHCLYGDQFARDIHVQGRQQLQQLSAGSERLFERADFPLYGNDPGWKPLTTINGYQVMAWRWPSVCADPERALPSDATQAQRIEAHKDRFDQTNRGDNLCAAKHGLYVAACNGPRCAPLSSDPRSGASISNWDIQEILVDTAQNRIGFDAGLSMGAECRWDERRFLCDINAFDGATQAGTIRTGEVLSWMYRTVSGGVGDEIYFGSDMVIAPVHIAHSAGSPSTIRLMVGTMGGPLNEVTVEIDEPTMKQTISAGGTSVDLIGGCDPTLNYCRFEASYLKDVPPHPWFSVGNNIQPPWRGADLNNMRCGGFTVDQFSALDFDAMDLQSSLVRDETDFADEGQLTSAYEDSTGEFVADFRAGAVQNRENAELLMRIFPSDGQTPWEATVEVASMMADNTHPDGYREVTSVRVEWDDYLGTVTETSALNGTRFRLTHIYDEAGDGDTSHIKRNNVVVTVFLNGAPPRVLNARAWTWEDEKPMAARNTTRMVNDGVNEFDPRAGVTGEVPTPDLGRQF